LMLRSAATATLIAVAVQIFAVGILAPRLPREVLPPGLESTRTFSFPVVPAVHIKNADGTVRVNALDDFREIKVDAMIRAYTSDTESAAIAESYFASLFDVTESDEIVDISTEPEERPDTLDLRVDYTVTVPRGTNIVLEISNGNVWVAEGCNQVSVEANNADIEILNPAGKTSVKTINGRIHAVDCADEVVLETVNGSIVTSLSNGALQASTVTGGITATLLDKAVGVCDLTSLNGSITLVMSERLSVEVNATTEQGVVRADVPLTPVGGVQKRREIHGMLGNGNTKVSVNSMNGDITLQRSVT